MKKMYNKPLSLIDKVYVTNAFKRTVKEKDELVLANQLLENQLLKYTEAYNILMEYFDSIPDEEKQKVDNELKELGL